MILRTAHTDFSPNVPIGENVVLWMMKYLYVSARFPESG